jgi:hypothetical protein
MNRPFLSLFYISGNMQFQEAARASPVWIVRPVYTGIENKYTPGPGGPKNR